MPWSHAILEARWQQNFVSSLSVEFRHWISWRIGSCWRGSTFSGENRGQALKLQYFLNKPTPPYRTDLRSKDRSQT